MIGEEGIRRWAMKFYIMETSSEELEDWKVFFLEEDYDSASVLGG